MVKKIKAYFARKREQKQLQNLIICEVLETLATICLYLGDQGRVTHHHTAHVMHIHFVALKKFSSMLRSVDERLFTEQADSSHYTTF